MSNTLEEISEALFCELADYMPKNTFRRQEAKQFILSALRLVERQTVERERERTCEWDLAHGERYSAAGCNDTHYAGGFPKYSKFCPQCGGIIKIKESK